MFPVRAYKLLTRFRTHRTTKSFWEPDIHLHRPNLQCASISEHRVNAQTIHCAVKAERVFSTSQPPKRKKLAVFCRSNVIPHMMFVYVSPKECESGELARENGEVFNVSNRVVPIERSICGCSLSSLQNYNCKRTRNVTVTFTRDPRSRAGFRNYIIGYACLWDTPIMIYYCLERN